MWSGLGGRVIRRVVLLFAAVRALATVFDFALSARPVSIGELALVAGLGLAVGAVHGLLVGLALAALSRTRRPVSWLVWLVLFGAVAVWVSFALGAPERLVGRYRALAMGTFVAAGLGAVAATVAVGLVQPSRADLARTGGVSDLSDWLARTVPAARARAGLRWAYVAVMVAFAVAAYVADHRLFAYEYTPFHTTLRLATIGALALAAFAAGVRGPRSIALGAGVAIIATGLVVAPLLVVTSSTIKLRAQLHKGPYAAASFDRVEALFDFDADGYSAVLGGGDCAPFDPNINPGATEVPGNGIDDNCRLGDAKPHVVDLDPSLVPVPTEPSKRSVVLITIDALRPDHMSAYGYARPTTPNIAKFFVGGTRFLRAYTPGGYTSIAVPSIFRGVYPRRIVWTRVLLSNLRGLFLPPLTTPLLPGEHLGVSYWMPVHDPHPTLAWWLERRGMVTSAVVDDDSTNFFEAKWGAARGFGAFQEMRSPVGVPWADDRTADVAIDALGAIPKDKPFFFWVHFFGPHFPSTHHDDVPDFGGDVAARYDNEIAHTDLEVARMLAFVDERFGDNPPAVILTSDHGEMLYASGQRNHGIHLSDSDTHVPLLVRSPDLAPGDVPSVVSTLDIVPSVLRWTGTPAPTWLDGRPLADATGPDAAARIVFTESWLWSAKGELLRDLIAAVDLHARFVFNQARNLQNADSLIGPSATESSPAERKRLSHAVFSYLDEVGGTIRIAR